MMITALAIAVGLVPQHAPAIPAQQQPCRRSNYRCRFRRLPLAWRRWAHATSYCESKDDPTIHNSTGIYHGAFQFTLGTWKAAGGRSDDPHVVPWWGQAFKAVHLAKTDGTQHWPVCG